MFSPSVQATFWTPAAALCLVVAAVGLPRVAALAWRGPGRAAARSALVFLAAGFVSAVVSPNPTVGFLGLYYWGTGWLFTASLAGAWAIGRSLDARGRRVVESAVLVAAVANAAVAVLEAMVDLGPFHLGRYGGRSPGFLGNPVHLGAFAAAALAIVAPRFRSAPRRWAPAAVVLAAGVQTSGSRFGLVVLVGVVGWAFASEGWRTGAALAGLAVAGLLLGSLAADAIDGGSQLASGRVAAVAGSGITPRASTWRDGAEAMTDRPVLGIGPGQFRTATSPLRGVELARHEGADRIFVDAHNLVVEYGVTTGLVGLAALLAMWAFATRGAGGALLVFALAEFANHLVEPQAVRTTPVMFLALGAAARGPTFARIGRAAVMVTVVAVVAAVGVAGTLLVGDFHLEQARLDFDRYHARRAYHLLPWPEAAEVRARVFLYEGRVARDEGLTRRGIRFLRDAVDRDRANPGLWANLGHRLLGVGDVTQSAVAFEEALRLNPTSTVARHGLARVALLRGQPAEAARWARESLAIEPSVTARTILRDARNAAG